MTFLAVEKRIASSLEERVQATADTINADDVRAIATRRQAGHWASATVAGSPEHPRQALHAVYDALVAAADFFALRNQHKRGFDYPDAAGMYRAYESELYRFDQLYRHFCEAADLAEAEGWNILKPLRADMENVLRQLVSDGPGPGLGQVHRAARRTARQVADREGAEPAPLLRPQRAALAGGRPTTGERSSSSATPSATRRPRNSPRNSTASTASRPTLTSQLGVLPSYTALGMASLLPHKTLAYKAGTRRAGGRQVERRR